MSISLLQVFLASFLGITTFYLLESIYYDILGRIRQRQEDNFWDYLEDDLYEYEFEEVKSKAKTRGK